MKASSSVRIIGLLAVLALASLLRANLTGSDIAGQLFERHDEGSYVKLVAQFLNGDWSVDYFGNPTLYMYLMYAATVVCGIVLIAAGRYESYSEFVLDATINPYLITIVGRSITVVVSVASVALIYLIGRRMFSTRVGLVAAAALASNRIHMEYGARAGNECLLVFLILLFFLALQTYLERPSARKHVLCGLLLGLAVSTKYSGGIHGVTLVTVTLAAALRTPRETGLARELLRPCYLAGFPAIVLGFVAGSPWTLLNYSKFIGGFQRMASYLHGGYSWEDIRAHQLGWFSYATEFPHKNNGTIFALLCGLGVFLALYRALRHRDTRAWMLLAAALPAYLYLGSGIFHRMSFLLVAIPFFLLLGAWTLDCVSLTLLRGWRSKDSPADEPPAWKKAVPLVLAVLLLFPHARRSAQHVAEKYGSDVRAELLVWMRNNVDRNRRYLDLCAPSRYRFFTMPHAGIQIRDLKTKAERRRFQMISERTFRSKHLGSILRAARDFQTFERLLQNAEQSHLIVLMAQRLHRDKDFRQQLRRALLSVPRRGLYRQTRYTYWSEAVSYLVSLEISDYTITSDRSAFMCVLKLP